MESVLEYIQFYARNNPEKTAVTASDGEITYCELWNKITGIADILRKSGIKKEDRILLEASHTVEYVALSFAIQLSGAIHVTSEHNAPIQRVNEISDITGCSLVLTGLHPLEKLNSDFDCIVGKNWSNNDFPSGEDIQEIMYTTGTTGKSKGVMLTHHAALFRCLSQIQGFGLKNDMVLLIPSPMNHAAGLRRMQLSMVNGSSVVLIDGFTDLKQFFRAIEVHHTDSIYLPPAGIHYILSLASNKLATFDERLKTVFSSSSFLSVNDKDKLNKILPNTEKFDGYGSSETGHSTFFEYSNTQPISGCVGKPLPGYDIFTVDEFYKPVAATKDNPGIIAVRSKGLACSYWNEPELTAKTFQDGVIYMTDMGYFEDGNLILSGRRDDVINIGGLKIAPAEVEEAAMKFPSVNECVCLPYKDKILGDTVVLYVSAVKGSEINDGDLSACLNTMLEKYKLPKRFFHLDEIPHTYNGKIDRKKLLGL